MLKRVSITCATLAVYFFSSAVASSQWVAICTDPVKENCLNLEEILTERLDETAEKRINRRIIKEIKDIYNNINWHAKDINEKILKLKEEEIRRDEEFRSYFKSAVSLMQEKLATSIVRQDMKEAIMKEILQKLRAERDLKLELLKKEILEEIDKK